MAPDGDFEGLTEDELAEMATSSEQQSGEDATTWAARAAREAADYKEKAAARRATETDSGLTPDEPSEAGTEDAPTGAPDGATGPVTN